jgi:hypothetical protein
MSVYTTVNSVNVPTGLDDAGLRASVVRLHDESLSDFRRRILLEVRDPSGPSEDDFVRSVNRKVGAFEVPVFTIDVLRDVNGNVIANNPAVVVTSAFIRLYSDYVAGTIDVELELRLTGNKFISDIIPLLDASSFFSCTAIGSNGAKHSKNLRYGSNRKHVNRQLLPQSHSNYLGHENIQGFWPESTGVFVTEQATSGAVAVDGDWHLDNDQGVLITHLHQRGVISYVYAEFPHAVNWQLVRAYPCNDDDIDYIHKDLMLDTDGVYRPLRLNSEGTEIMDALYTAHPLQWGK